MSSRDPIPGGVFDQAAQLLGADALAAILARAEQAKPLTETQLATLAALLIQPADDIDTAEAS